MSISPLSWPHLPVPRPTHPWTRHDCIHGYSIGNLEQVKPMEVDLQVKEKETEL